MLHKMHVQALNVVVLLVLCNESFIHANVYKMMQSSASTFNPLVRLGIRGGETATKSKQVPSISRVQTPASKSAPVGNGAPKKKRRKKRPAVSQPAIPPAPIKQKPKKINSAAKPKAVSSPKADAPEASSSIFDSVQAKQHPKKEAESQHDKMPSLFTRDEEKQYDIYAACLAATESLRRMRDSKVKNKKGTAVDVEDKSWKSMLRLSSDSNGNDENESGEEEHKRACAEYVLNSSKAINALGLSVTQFNQLGREISKSKSLKEKVMEQAYLYRMASTIKMDKIPLIQDPDSKQLLKSTRRRRVQMFVRSITEIEELRAEQNQRLRKALSIDKIPSDINLCDPNVMPLLSPKVRSVIEAFPLQAEEIVKKYGLNSDEFNQMLEETRGNPVFRWRVQRFRKKQDEEDGIDEDNSM